MKPILLGMNNPLSDDPRFALYPSPAGSAGWRLWQLLRARTGADMSQYRNTFERRNLVLTKEWSSRGARGAGGEFLATLGSTPRTVVVLGEETRKALGLPRQLVHPIVREGHTFRQLPHPSGRNLWYNDLGHRTVAGMLLEELYHKARR